jgi:hypothetical protein
MRLSWYADTGVAVFSIWQGSTCTGTFRLPIADLPRMVAALRRGPAGAARRHQASGAPGELPRPRHAAPPAPPPAGYGSEPPARYHVGRETYRDESPVRPYVTQPSGADRRQRPGRGEYPGGH